MLGLISYMKHANVRRRFSSLTVRVLVINKIIWVTLLASYWPVERDIPKTILGMNIKSNVRKYISQVPTIES